MPRNSSGTYSLPSGNPVVSGTLIEASWANTTLSDLASAMTNSLSRNGEGGMTAALRLFDGTVSLPGLAFTNETSTGLYRAGSGDMRLAVTGSQVVQFLTTGVAVTGTLSASGNTTLSGTLAVTGASTFSGQTNTFENATAYYPQLINRNKTNDANGSYIVIDKIRGSSIIQNGDVLGNLVFRGYDGTQYLQGAYINAIISAAPGTNDMPTDLVFGTTSDGGAGPTERLRISNTGAGTASADWTFYGVRVGRGAGSVSTNTAVGASALAANTTGDYITAIGTEALGANTSGVRNTAVGRRSLYTNTTGGYNSALGMGALYANSTGSYNTAVGQDAFTSSTTASNNTAVGYQAGYSNSTGSGTFIGAQTGYQNTTGAYNVAVGVRDANGANTFESNTTGSYNTALGSGALYANTTGTYTTAVGYKAAYSNTTASYNTAVGMYALYTANRTADTNGYNCAIGAWAGYSITTGNFNTLIGTSVGGYGAGHLITTGSKNSILGGYNGNQGGLDIRTASNNIVLSDGDGNPVAYRATNGMWTLGGGGTDSGVRTYEGALTLNGAAVSGRGAAIQGQSNGTNSWYAGSYSYVVSGTSQFFAVSNSGGGGVYLNGTTATSWTAVSDETRKVIIEPITDAANKVSTLRAVIGRLKSDEETVRRPYLIAQDVQIVLPEAVSEAEDKDGPLLGLSYTEVIPLLVAAIKELKAEIDALKGQA